MKEDFMNYKYKQCDFYLKISRVTVNFLVDTKQFVSYKLEIITTYESKIWCEWSPQCILCTTILL